MHLVRALWTTWFYKGGLPASAKELQGIVADLADSFDAESFDADSAGQMVVLDGERAPLPQDVRSQQVYTHFTSFWTSMEPRLRAKLMARVSADAVLDDRCWSELYPHFKEHGLREEYYGHFRSFMMRDTEPAPRPSDEGVWNEHALHTTRTLTRDVDVNLWILKYLEKSTIWSLDVEEPDLNLPQKVADRCAESTFTFSSILEVLILAPLYAKGDGAGRTSAVPHSCRVLQDLTERWSQAVLDNGGEDEATGGPFEVGRTFLDCTTSQAKMVKNAIDAKKRADIAAGLIKLKEADRREVKAQQEKARLAHEAAREVARGKAKKEMQERHDERYNMLEEEAVNLHEKASIANSDNNTLGIDPLGVAVVQIPRTQLLNLANNKNLFSRAQQCCLSQANLFYVDISQREDANTFLRAHLLFLQEYHKTCAIAVFCTLEQYGLVNCRLVDAGYGRISLPYVMTTTLESHTLSNQGAGDVYGKHPLILDREEGDVPYKTPFGIIIRAAPDHGGNAPRKDPTSLKRGGKQFARTMANTCPRLAGSIPDKDRFTIDLSKDWQVEDSDPVCKSYPFPFAFASWIWWNTHPQDIVVVTADDPTFALAGVFHGLRVLALDSTDGGGPSGDMERGLKTCSYMAHQLVRDKYLLTLPVFLSRYSKTKKLSKTHRSV